MAGAKYICISISRRKKNIDFRCLLHHPHNYVRSLVYSPLRRRGLIILALFFDFIVMIFPLILIFKCVPLLHFKFVPQLLI